MKCIAKKEISETREMKPRTKQNGRISPESEEGTDDDLKMDRKLKSLEIKHKVEIHKLEVRKRQLEIESLELQIMQQRKDLDIDDDFDD